jgi:uncharacterized protein YodC (DUF2158 family)
VEVLTMSQFQVGDVVQLKSGGPVMTVENPSFQGGGGPVVRCEWFDAKGVKQVGTFREDMLERYDSGSPARIVDKGEGW